MSIQPSQANSESGNKILYPAFVCSDGTTLAVTARLSNKARNHRVILHHQGILEIVIPARSYHARQELEPERVALFLEEKRSWIERAVRRIAPMMENYRLGLEAGLPTHLSFPPLNELWSIEYHMTSATRITMKIGPGTELHIHGPITENEPCFEALRRFVTAYAKEQLPSFAWRIVQELTKTGQLSKRPVNITVNNRKSAWGVCTKDGRIRIDRRVLFLPYDLACQIIYHELAHLTHLSHKQAFYEKLYSFDGSSREAEKTVKQASSYIPVWL